MFAKKAAQITPGFSNTNLSCAVLNVKPISLQHLPLSKESIRDYWLNRSALANAEWVRVQWDNIQVLLKFRHVRFNGKGIFQHLRLDKFQNFYGLSASIILSVGSAKGSIVLRELFSLTNLSEMFFSGRVTAVKQELLESRQEKYGYVDLDSGKLRFCAKLQ